MKIIIISLFMLYNVGVQSQCHGNGCEQIAKVMKQESGLCSWYGAEGQIPEGYILASGEPFSRNALRASHRSLPFGTRIRVTNRDNGKCVDVVINDRGATGHGQVVHLTYGAFGQIAYHGVGTISCSYVTT